jgi:hypothetical protein
VAAVISIGAVVSATGMGPKLADGLLSILPLVPGAHFANFMISALWRHCSVRSRRSGHPAVLTPLASHLAAAATLRCRP